MVTQLCCKLWSGLLGQSAVLFWQYNVAFQQLNQHSISKNHFIFICIAHKERTVCVTTNEKMSIRGHEHPAQKGCMCSSDRGQQRTESTTNTKRQRTFFRGRTFWCPRTFKNVLCRLVSVVDSVLWHIALQTHKHIHVLFMNWGLRVCQHAQKGFMCSSNRERRATVWIMLVIQSGPRK